jgi:hypothetical protein
LLHAQAGIRRTPGSVRRHCVNEQLSARRVETKFGEKFLITPLRYQIGATPKNQLSENMS